MGSNRKRDAGHRPRGPVLDGGDPQVADRLGRLHRDEDDPGIEGALSLTGKRRCGQATLLEIAEHVHLVAGLLAIGQHPLGQQHASGKIGSKCLRSPLGTVGQLGQAQQFVLNPDQVGSRLGVNRQWPVGPSAGQHHRGRIGRLEPLDDLDRLARRPGQQRATVGIAVMHARRIVEYDHDTATESRIAGGDRSLQKRFGKRHRQQSTQRHPRRQQQQLLETAHPVAAEELVGEEPRG